MRRPGAGTGRRSGFRGIGGGVASAPVALTAPVISGTVTINGSLSIAAGTYSGVPAPTLTYDIRRDGVAIVGQTGLTEAQAEAYDFVADDIGPVIDVVEYAVNAAGSTSQDSNNLTFAVTSLTNLRGWLRADLGITLSGADVDVWADQSGAGNDFSAAAAGNRPVYIATDSGFDDQPCVQFDGASEWLRDTAFDWGGAPTVFSVWFVVRIDSLTNLDRCLTYDASGFSFAMGTGPIVRCAGPGGGLSSFAWSGVEAWGFTWDGATQTLYENATQRDQDANASAAPADDAVFALGASTTGTLTGAVTIAEVVVCRAVLSTDERATLAAYFTWRYGV